MFSINDRFALAGHGEKIWEGMSYEPPRMSKEEAENFFGELFYGKHHIPSDVKEYGYGWYVFTNCGLSFATTDYNNLTRMVLMAHRDAIRVEIKTHSPGRLKICIWKRIREGTLTNSHPTIEQAIESFKNFPPRI